MTDLENLFEDIEVIDVEETKKEEPKKQKETDEKSKQYKYPFEIYLAAQRPSIDHIFEEEKEYTEKEITKAMLDHGFYEFAGSVTYDFRENENVLIPIFQQHKKG